MPGQFINSGNGGRISLANNSNTGRITMGGSAPTVYNFSGSWSFMDRAEACSGLQSFGANYFSLTPLTSITNGSQIYTDAEFTTTPNQSFITLNSISYANTGGVLSSGQACGSSFYSWRSSNTVGGNNPGNRCTPDYSITLYSFTNDITVLGNNDLSPSNFLYTDTSLTNKFTGNPPGNGGFYKITLVNGDGTGYACDFVGDGHIFFYSAC
jgi:hypothetical protein